MKALTKREFERLAATDSSSCVSFYLPTHRAGMEVINQLDSLVFKNQLKAVGEKLKGRGWDESNIIEFLAPAKELLNNSDFWHNQEDGLAIFLNHSSLDFYNLPFSVEPYFHISNRFYLRPITPLFSGNGDFFVLGLNLHHITFFKGNRERLKEVFIDAPQQMEEVAGYDFEEKFLQVRSQHDGRKQGIFHGHGEWKGEIKKGEIEKFFREVDKSVNQLIGGKNIPLVTIGQEYLTSIYKKVNSYPHFIEEAIELDVEHLGLKELHEKIWQKLYARFDVQRVKKIETIKELHNTLKTSFDISEIIPAAINGKVDTLFVQKGAEIWGHFDKTNNSIILEEEQSVSNISLLNLAVIEVLQKGGTVYEQIAETMPLPYVALNALYRF